MRTWAAAIVAVGMVTGCNYGPNAFNCTDSSSCGTGGTCQPNNFCSFPDASCASGQRYGDLSGPNSGRCVGDEPPGDDAGIDSPPDARACFGTAPFTICLASAPTTALTISMPTTVVTNSSNSMCAVLVSGGDYCVLTATTISIDARLRATGLRPLVLLASDSITITTNGVIDVGSHRGDTLEIGAGAEPVACVGGTQPGSGGGTNGGGAGGSFGGPGGTGGAGGKGGAGGTPEAAATDFTTLRGGCAGQSGRGPSSSGGAGGHGGGAVLLIAGNTIDHVGTINAAGEGGGGSPTGSSGGGGGGAGGMIVLDAQTISGSGLILANGGGGGEGSGPTIGGADGSDPVTITAAPGGSGSPDGGDGGDGSAGGPGSGGNGMIGASGSSPGGGGGGGGGAGVVKASADPGPNVSPAPTP